VIFDLVADDVGMAHRLVEQCRREIADADEAGLAGLAQSGHRLERLGQGHGAARPMDQQQVEMIEAQLLEAVLGAARDVLRREMVARQFCRDPQLATGDSGLRDALADLGLVAIELRGIDVAITHGDRVAHRAGAIGTVQRPGAEAQRRHARVFYLDEFHVAAFRSKLGP
jgi:hypothetical protein